MTKIRKKTRNHKNKMVTEPVQHEEKSPDPGDQEENHKEEIVAARSCKIFAKRTMNFLQTIQSFSTSDEPTTISDQNSISVSELIASFSNIKKSDKFDFVDEKKASSFTALCPSAATNLKQERKYTFMPTDPAHNTKQQCLSPYKLGNKLLEQHQKIQEKINLLLKNSKKVGHLETSSPVVSDKTGKTADTVVVTESPVQCKSSNLDLIEFASDLGSHNEIVPMESALDLNCQNQIVPMELSENIKQVITEDDPMNLSTTVTKPPISSCSTLVNSPSISSIVNNSSKLSIASSGMTVRKMSQLMDISEYYKHSSGCQMNLKDSMNNDWKPFTVGFEQSHLSNTLYNSGTPRFINDATPDRFSLFSPPLEIIPLEINNSSTSMEHIENTPNEELKTKIKPTTVVSENENEDFSNKNNAAMVRDSSSPSEPAQNLGWKLNMVTKRNSHLKRNEVMGQELIINPVTGESTVDEMALTVVQNAQNNLNIQRLRLIIDLQKVDAELIVQKLHEENTLEPNNMLIGEQPLYQLHSVAPKSGKKLIIDSLCVPLLSLPSTYQKNEMSKKINNFTVREFRHYVCVVRTETMIRKPRLIVATGIVDAVIERIKWSSSNKSTDPRYVEFIKYPNDYKNNDGRFIGGPLKIDPFDDNETPTWKCVLELYGMNNDCGAKLDEDNTQNVMVEQLSSVTTTLGGSSTKHQKYGDNESVDFALRPTAFHLVGSFVFSSEQVNQQLFTLTNKYQQQDAGLSTTVNTPVLETVRMRMQLIDDTEENMENICNDQNTIEARSSKRFSLGGQLYLPIVALQNCFWGTLILCSGYDITETDDDIKTDVNADISYLTSWRRLWFRMHVVENVGNNGLTSTEDRKNKWIKPKQTIALSYWFCSEHEEIQREPLGFIDLSRCVKPSSAIGIEEKQLDDRLPADIFHFSAQPNGFRLLDYGINGEHIHNVEVFMLAAETSEEQESWCTSINAAVQAIAEYYEKDRLEWNSKAPEAGKTDRIESVESLSKSE